MEYDYDFERCPTRVDPMGPYSEQDVYHAILASHSNYAEMSRLLGRRRNKVRDFVLSKPDLKALFDETREALIDDVEANVFAGALAGDGPSQRFVLSTIGKNRGYSTRHETTGPDGGPITVITDAMSLQEAADAYADTVRN